jgi:peptidyl-prolyl cis-trans isomerase A (cyclophilin A)
MTTGLLTVWRLDRLKRGAFVGILLALGLACGGSSSDAPAVDSLLPDMVPDTVLVRFETSRGPFDVEIIRAWAPEGARRARDLVAAGFFDENRFYRVVPGFVAQWGVNDKKERNDWWDARPLPDDPKRESNIRGTVTFAHSGPGTRAQQLFINLKDNRRLDTLGFVPVGRVISGMAVVDSIFAEYGEKPDFHLISTLGNSYLRRMFPKLDYITRATVVTPR